MGIRYTPKPWVASSKPGSYDICVVEHEDPRQSWYVTTGDKQQRAAPEIDARFIAMAPEIFEALEELVDLMDDMVAGNYKPDSFTTQPARSIIAKVKGENNATVPGL